MSVKHILFVAILVSIFACVDCRSQKVEEILAKAKEQGFQEKLLQSIIDANKIKTLTTECDLLFCKSTDCGK